MLIPRSTSLNLNSIELGGPDTALFFPLANTVPWVLCFVTSNLLAWQQVGHGLQPRSLWRIPTAAVSIAYSRSPYGESLLRL